MSRLIQRQTVGLREEKGQALVIIAFAMVGLMAFLGLVTDIGWGMYQKRLAQNGADAAVKAALGAIVKAGASCSDSTLTTAVGTTATTYVQNNAGATASASTAPYFIDNNGAAVTSGPCANAAGVRVTATVPYETFFLRIIGIGSATTSAVAAGKVRAFFTRDAPFIACGPSLVQSSNNSIRHNIFVNNTPPTIDYANKAGLTFDLHDEQLPQNGGGCGAGNQFKGNAGTDQSAYPTQYNWDNGTRAGPTRVRVAGAAPGCNNSTDPNPKGSDLGDPPCIVPIPVAISCTGSGNNGTCQVVTWALFLITRIDANSHTGTLQPPGILEGDSEDCTPPCTRPAVLTLTE